MISKTFNTVVQTLPILSLNLATLETNRLAFEERLNRVGQLGSPMERIAEWFGGVYIEGDVRSTQDTQIMHEAARVLSMVVMQVDLDGLGGQILWAPAGGVNRNQQPWSKTSVYLRATRQGRYAAVLI